MSAALSSIRCPFGRLRVLLAPFSCLLTTLSAAVPWAFDLPPGPCCTAVLLQGVICKSFGALFGVVNLSREIY